MIWAWIGGGLAAVLVVMFCLGGLAARGLGDVGILDEDEDDRSPVARMVDRLDPAGRALARSGPRTTGTGARSILGSLRR
jgi:hypothetical protein